MCGRYGRRADKQRIAEYMRKPSTRTCSMTPILLPRTTRHPGYAPRL